MNTSLSKINHFQTVTIHLQFENVHALLADIHLYLFGADGEMLEEQSFRRGKATLTATDEELRDGRIVVAPLLDDSIDDPLTLKMALQHPVFETVLDFDEGRTSYELPIVPEALWRLWLTPNLWKKPHETSRSKSAFLIW
jgi:hypothetical protein